MPLPRSDWLTGVRLERLVIILRNVLPDRPGVSLTEARVMLWQKCGGPIEEVDQLIYVLVALNLVSDNQGVFRRSSAGNTVSRNLRRDNYIPLGLQLIRAGCFFDQARKLIESGTTDESGNFVCPRRVGRSLAPQLLGVLSWWPDCETSPAILVPAELFQELSTIWALRAPEPEQPPWVIQRQRIGKRAEIYSVQLERGQAKDPTEIAWVAEDSDYLGWDIEDRSADPVRRVEVKGSRNRDPIFYLSENEMKKAHTHGANYEVHFWGEIDLNREEPIEYAALRAVGYPLVIPNIAAEIASGEWDATAVQWRIQRAGEA